MTRKQYFIYFFLMDDDWVLLGSEDYPKISNKDIVWMNDNCGIKYVDDVVDENANNLYKVLKRNNII